MIAYIISFATNLCWLLPPFKQYRTKYFLYFLIVACVGPVCIFLVLVFHMLIAQLTAIFGFLAFYSLLKPTLKLKIGFMIIITGLMLSTAILSDQQMHLINVIIQTIILITFVYDFLVFTEKRKTLNLFYILIITYQITVVYKFIAWILDMHQGITVFYLTTFLEMFYGILFAFINVDTKNFRLFKETEEA